MWRSSPDTFRRQFDPNVLKSTGAQTRQVKDGAKEFLHTTLPDGTTIITDRVGQYSRYRVTLRNGGPVGVYRGVEGQNAALKGVYDQTLASDAAILGQKITQDAFTRVKPENGKLAKVLSPFKAVGKSFNYKGVTNSTAKAAGLSVADGVVTAAGATAAGAATLKATESRITNQALRGTTVAVASAAGGGVTHGVFRVGVTKVAPAVGKFAMKLFRKS